MQENIKKVVMDDAPVVMDSLKIGVYTIYDCVLKQFDIPISIPVSKLYDYMVLLVNDVNSKYYNHESDYILNKIGDFNTDSGEIELHFVERIQTLDKYVDKQKRTLQTVIQTLNYLPTGYFKMPVEQKQAIQEKIDNAITKYVEDYVVPDMDINSQKEKLYRNRCINFVKNLRQFTEEPHWEIPDVTCDALDDVIDGFYELFDKPLK